ncbi:Ldh family oxidoreductase [Mediterraneibacter sp. NSJ-55]|uniref:Ldh family oxidoreductase n=1 Tax=Mediterraneibacter hominis TaxID=2763054 RepID=A0A923RRM2_9FIRM|nr:Ldh family oxidoreductase [Mediterraneibacter hominis]MBC5689868.1 Ldh family oxidoreductase [Mediterraneibacter hominis]
MKNYKVMEKQLKIFTQKVFSKAGLTEKQAQSVAELLVHADVRGVSSHGVLRTKSYIDKIRGGGASVKSEYPIVSETANTAVIDAQGGLGAVAGEKAVKIAREKAKTNLISIVSVKNSNHFGMAGHWAMKLAGEEYIGFACSNTDPSMAPPGVTVPFIGNNPFSFAFAAGGKYPEVCVDMATSAAAFGKAKAYAMAGKQIPEGWLLDKEGKPTTDLEKYGMLVPMAEHKGFGIAFIVELFATLLSGGVLSPDVNDQDLPDTPELSSQSFGCVNISAFRDLQKFHTDAEKYIDALKALPVGEEIDSAKYPGEIEYTNKQKNLKEGILLPETLTAQLKETGKELGLAAEDMEFLELIEA